MHARAYPLCLLLLLGACDTSRLPLAYQDDPRVLVDRSSAAPDIQPLLLIALTRAGGLEAGINQVAARRLATRSPSVGASGATIEQERVSVAKEVEQARTGILRAKASSICEENNVKAGALMPGLLGVAAQLADAASQGSAVRCMEDYDRTGLLPRLRNRSEGV